MIPLNLDLRYGTISSLIDPNSVQTAWKNNDGLGRVTQETIVAYNNDNYLAASQDGGATLAGFVGGALGGAEFAFFFGPADFLTLPAGAMIGAAYGAYVGHSVGGSIYNAGFEPPDQPGLNTRSIYPY